MRLIVTDAARADLKEIARYSGREWGAARKQRYMQLMRDRFRELLRSPDLGPARDELGACHRGLVAGSHVIFYRRVRGQIVVMRVLHQRMDVHLHL